MKNNDKTAGGKPNPYLLDEVGQFPGHMIKYVAGFDDYKEDGLGSVTLYEREIETPEFIALQKELLFHKKMYYVEDMSVISDYDYDMLENKSYKMAQELGFRADKWEGAEENEKHHVHWMVGYDEKSIYNN